MEAPLIGPAIQVADGDSIAEAARADAHTSCSKLMNHDAAHEL
jgi:hypothetical protein